MPVFSGMGIKEFVAKTVRKKKKETSTLFNDTMITVSLVTINFQIPDTKGDTLID